MPEIELLCWNLFHGRDDPPEPGLHTLRSKLLGTTARGQEYVQVNHDLLGEFAVTLADASWDVAALQECPPRWEEPLARACGAESHRTLTARNQLGPLRSTLARLNPDLMGSWEGGSNLTLVRPTAGEVTQTRELVLRRGRPERRSLIFTRLSTGICVANFHASTVGRLATEEVERAARRTSLWAGRDRLVLAGDFNLRPTLHWELYARLAEHSELAGITAEDAIDHILMADEHRAAASSAWPDGRREHRRGSLRLRLSDHAPIEAAVYSAAAPPG